MARKYNREHIAQFRGADVATPIEELPPTVLVDGTLNMFVRDRKLKPRGSTRMLHGLSLAGPINGLTQWNPAGTRQIVAIANGNFYYKIYGALNFTAIASALATVRTVSFAPYRTAGGAIHLFFADGALRRWDGAALTLAFAGAPAAQRIREYKGRLWATDGSKTLYGCKIADPTVWGVVNGGIAADVETFDAFGLVGLAKSGDSLLLFKSDNIARLSGNDPDSIDVATDTRGVSNVVGCDSPDTIVELEEGDVFFMSDRGPYLANESGVRPVPNWKNVKPIFDGLNQTTRANMTAAFHRGLRQVWISGPFEGYTYNELTIIYDIDLQQWFYKFQFLGLGSPTYFYAPTVWSRLERDDGSEALMFGNINGDVLETDPPGMDFVCDHAVQGNTDGQRVTCAAYLPLVLGLPDVKKRLHNFLQQINALIPAGTTFNVQLFGVTANAIVGQVALPSVSGVAQAYVFKLAGAIDEIPVLRMIATNVKSPLEIDSLTLQMVIGK